MKHYFKAQSHAKVLHEFICECENNFEYLFAVKDWLATCFPVEIRVLLCQIYTTMCPFIENSAKWTLKVYLSGFEIYITAIKFLSIINK